MRFLDIGLAAMLGISAFAGLAVWSPRTGDRLSNQMMLQTQLRDELVSILANKGIPWLLNASAIEVCASIASAMSRPGGVLVILGTEWCGTSPPTGAVVANLTLALLPSVVRLVEWSTV